MTQKINFRNWLHIIAASTTVAILVGCTAISTHPLAARPGDTLTLAVGTPEDMTTANTNVFFTPNGGTQFELGIRSIFKLYPDNTSTVWLDNGSTPFIERDTGHGPWTTILAIDLPETLPDLTSIPLGPGVISVNTTTTYPPLTTHINNIPIDLEILADTGNRNPFTYEILNGARGANNLADLEPMGRLIIKPDYTGAGGTTYGAVEVTITIPGLESAEESSFHVVLDKKIGHDNSRRSQFFWAKPGNDIIASLINPTGTLEYYDVHFSIITPNLNLLIQIGAITIESITVTAIYYDMNGQTVSGPMLNVIDAS